MKILAPLSHTDDFDNLVKAGADEFYCGMLPYEWIEKYGFNLNRRDYRSNASFHSMLSLKIINKKALESNTQVKITINNLLYSQAQYDTIFELVKRYMDLGFEHFIIADIGLFVFLRDKGVPCKIHFSGEAPIINSSAIELLMQYGFTRLIFPRKTSITDMESCIQKFGTKLEYESFILNENCPYTGAFCNTIHCDELRNSCHLPYSVQLLETASDRFSTFYKYLRMINTSSSRRATNSAKDHFIGNSGCGLCFIKELNDIGITNLKVVGRGADSEGLIKDIQSIKKAVQMIDLSTEDEYPNRIIDEYFDGKCTHSYKFCYYPKWMSGKIVANK